MKMFVRIITVFIMSGCFLPLQAEPSADKIRVIVSEANVYLKPNAESLVILQVRAGAILTGEKYDEAWYKTALPPDKDGFIAVGFLKAADVEVLAEEKPVVKEATPLKPEKREPEPAQARTHDKRAMISASRFSLAISPGLGIGLFKTNDLNKYIDYMASLYDESSDYFEWKASRLYMNIGLEALYQISRSFGLGFGVGYLQHGSSGKYGWDDGDYFGHYERNFMIRALTMQLNLYQSFRLGRNISFQLTGGGDAFVSFLNAKGNYDYDYLVRTYYKIWGMTFIFLENVKAKGDYSDRYSGFSLGFHAGIQFQIDLSPRVALVFGSLFQWAKLSNFLWNEHIGNGEASSETEEGTLWFYDAPGGSKSFSVFVKPPTNENYHKANFDLSGISLRAGIKIGL